MAVFTGFDLEELRSPAARSLLAVTDLLVAGRYIAALRTTELALRGSTNQRIHLLTDRYIISTLTKTTTCEVHIQSDGTLVLTGLPPAELFGWAKS